MMALGALGALATALYAFRRENGAEHETTTEERCAALHLSLGWTRRHV
jgi:hypothetical protein